jgi:hypothetical protein
MEKMGKNGLATSRTKGLLLATRPCRKSKRLHMLLRFYRFAGGWPKADVTLEKPNVNAATQSREPIA